MRLKSNNPKLRNMLQNYWLVCFKIINVKYSVNVKYEESQRHWSMLKETRDMATEGYA